MPGTTALPPARLLLRDACVIDTEPHPVALPHHDVLIEGDRIAAVGPRLPADGAQVLDARGHIVLPGFVDTHRHLWQTPLRAAAVDTDLDGYLRHVLGELGPRLRPEDLRTANLAGALECLDAGITTVQDFSHAQYTPDHTAAALDGLHAAGIRAVFGYGYPVFSPEARRTDDVRRAHALHTTSGATGLVSFALAPLGPSYSPIDTVTEDWRLARELGLRLAVHTGASPDTPRPVDALARAGLLGPDTLYVHGNSLPDDELRRIADSGGTASIAPAVEAAMGHGAPMINRLRAAGVTTGLGADVVTTVAGDMFSLMRAALTTGHLCPDGERPTAATVLRMATQDGAAALGLADTIGSLRPGKQADLILLRAGAVNLAAHHDPVGAVVTCAHPGNIDTVLVAGRPVKQAGRLLNPHLTDTLTRLHDTAARLRHP
ncbi:amidohydrolase family protein [Streptomyces echinatus]|uniref:Cytosine/adenosine deaminase-related metal-dependent hydrolase n=1 Tax=Streptomyces echinatus TaxID=67293 RepID=A0A7W9Q4N2_9ACTN|nr:amidohydrolase family protein [Streptomyces echinatus]MBB5932512.1 cytosine/adenosine deaminase-related metal-dependent hydrolase [Streptomyces echinatus]